MAMFNLTKKADYALAMLTHLAFRGDGARVSLGELAGRGMPRAFMAQIANNLVRNGILVSKEGRGGGYGLSRKPTKIQVREILEAIEGEVAPVSCVLAVGRCPAEAMCGQRKFMKKVTREIEDLLAKYSLADVVEG